MERNITRRIWPFLFAAMIAVAALAVPGTIAVLADRSASVVNTFCPDQVIYAQGDVDILVLKTVRNLGSRAKLPEGFQFLLKNVNTGEETMATTDANGRASFRLSFDADDVGTHEYRLSEVQGAEPGVTYSGLVYEVRAEVTLASDLQVAVYLDGQRTERVQASFENLFDSAKVPPATGDKAPLLLYGALILVSSAGIGTLIRRGRKDMG